MTFVVVLVSAVFLFLASLADLKTSEIPDKLSLGLVSALVLLAVFFSILLNNYRVLLSTLVLGLAYLLLGYGIFRLGQWGGGDVKLLAGVGLSLGLLDGLGFFWVNSRLVPYYITFFVDMAFLSFPYLLFYAAFLSFRRPEVFVKFRESLNDRKVLLLLCFSFLPLLVAFNFTLSLAFWYSIIPLMLFVSVYLKAVEKVALQKTISVSELRKWDVPASDVFVDGVKLAQSRNIEGLTQKQVDELKKLAREGKIPSEIRIKWGVKFVPILLAAYVATLYAGNLIEIMFKYLLV